MTFAGGGVMFASGETTPAGGGTVYAAHTWRYAAPGSEPAGTDWWGGWGGGPHSKEISMPNPDYIPLADPDFHSWQVNFVAYVSANFAALGLTVADSTALGAAQSPWKVAFPAHASAAAAAVAARQTKDDARDAFVAVIRSLVRRIQVAPVVTDAQRGALGISIRQSGGGGSGGPPTTRPLVSIDVTARLRHTIHFKDEATPTSKARPKGVIGAEVWVKLVPVGEPPPLGGGGAEGMTFIATCTRTPCIADHPASGGGMNAHYMLRWVNRRGQTGPWSETASATVGV